jgi:hypothetical protein
MTTAPKPQTKNQHYVPQFLIRQFAAPNTNEKAVAILNLSRKAIIPQGPIKSQCYGRYIYGDDDVIEQKLIKIEGAAARVIKKISREKQVQLSNHEQFDLIHFIAVQYGRTPAAGREIQQQHVQMNRVFLESAAARGIKPEEVQLPSAPQKPEIDSLHASVSTALVSWDLKDLLIINDASLEFAVSDLGLILHNQWTNGLSGPGTNGTVSRGIIYFFPLSPRLTLLKYDGDVYHIDGAVEGKLYVTSDSEVKSLNNLQIVFAEDNLYFSGDAATGASLLNLTGNANRISRSSRIRVERFVQQGNPEGELIAIHSDNPKLGLCLPWLRIRKSFERIAPHKRFQQYRPKALESYHWLQKRLGEEPEEPGPAMHGAVFRPAPKSKRP